MTNAAAVAQALKRGGLNTVPTRTRHGIKVSSAGTKGAVFLTIQHDGYPDDMERWARDLRDDALAVLRAAGYTVTPKVADTDDECDLFLVTRKA